MKELLINLTALIHEATIYLARQNGLVVKKEGPQPGSSAPAAERKTRTRKPKAEKKPADELAPASEPAGPASASASASASAAAAETNGNAEGQVPAELAKLSEQESSKLMMSVCRGYVEKNEVPNLEIIRAIMRDQYKTERMSNLKHEQRLDLIQRVQKEDAAVS